jgi:hypothetical protein
MTSNPQSACSRRSGALDAVSEPHPQLVWRVLPEARVPQSMKDKQACAEKTVSCSEWRSGHGFAMSCEQCGNSF